MKAIILIISVIISIIGLIAGQVIYPIIASGLNSSPTFFALWLGIPLFFILLLIAYNITKDHFTQISILFTLLICTFANLVFLHHRFGLVKYRNGYCYYNGLKNQVGAIITTSGCSAPWYRGFNESREEVFVNAHIETDDNLQFHYQIMVFDKDGNFENEKSFTLYNKKIDFYNVFNQETKYFIKEHTNVSVYDRIW